MKFMKLFSVLFLLSFTLSCTQKSEDSNAETSNDGTSTVDEDAVAVNEETKNHVNDILDKYYELKAALVESDAQKAQTAGQELSEVINTFNFESVSENTLGAYKNFTNKIQEGAKAVAASDDIEQQRETFADITDQVYKMTKTYAANDDPVYYTYCPMAFDNQGGYWLSEEEAVKNPYFGDKMLKCGSVKETIAKN